MPVYAVFGGMLDSEIHFQGMQPVIGCTPTWTFRLDGSASTEVVSLIGSEEVSRDLRLTLSRAADGSLVLSYSAYGLGEFVISRDGREIRWRPGTDPWLDALRWVLMGRVMATALYAAGTLCLHGSGVLHEGQGICFLAAKFHGKSTLAAAMVAAGARLAADDILPVEPGPPPQMWPGVPSVRLSRDSEEVLEFSAHAGGQAAEDLGKVRIDFPNEADSMRAPQTLSAIYLLAPGRDEPKRGLAVVRDLLSGVTALQELVRQASIAPLISPEEGRLLLHNAAAITRSVPIYRLRIIRDFDRLPEVVARLQAWHSVSARTGQN